MRRKCSAVRQLTLSAEVKLSDLSMFDVFAKEHFVLALP